MERATTKTTAEFLWEVEWRLVEIAAEQTGMARHKITPESRLLEDLGMDSLELVEFIMVVEETFGVMLPEESGRQVFIDQPATVRLVAQWVLQQWGTGTPNRRNWFAPKEQIQRGDSVPFMQLGGVISVREWLEGQLYEPLGTGREGFSQFRRRTDGMRCILIPEAEVWIGSDDPNGLSDERPSHRVHLRQFHIDAEPVSNLAFARFLNSIGNLHPSVLTEWCEVGEHARRAHHFQLERSLGKWKPISKTERQPVILISWYGANAYSLWANRQDWRYYRGDNTVSESLRALEIKAEAAADVRWCTFLPSEAQWEYAARGSDARRYPWGEEPPTPRRARIAQHRIGASYEANSLPSADVSERLGISPFGLHHMAGNVWQWCGDWYLPDFYQRSESRQRNPRNEEVTGIRSERGGSWVGPAVLSRSSYRRGRPPNARGRCLGFRCIGSTRDFPQKAQSAA